MNDLRTPDESTWPAPLAEALEPGEAVVWTGRPARLPAPERLAVGTALALPLFGGAAMGGAWALEVGVPVGVLTTLAVALVVTGGAGFFGEIRRQMTTRYVVTDRRPLIVHPGGHVDEVPAWTVGERRKDVRYTGRGTIRFAPFEDYAFRHIDGVRAAEAALAALPSARTMAPAVLARHRDRSDASQVPPRVLRALAGVLEDGEAVRWWGHPDEAAVKNTANAYRRHSLRSSSVVLRLAVGLLFAQMLLMAWMLSQGEPIYTNALQLLTPLLLLGGALLSQRRMRQRLYVVTDRRALVLTPEKGAYRVRSVLPRELARRRRVKSHHNVVSIRFDGETAPPTSLDADAFVGPKPVALVDALLDRLVADAPDGAGAVNDSVAPPVPTARARHQEIARPDRPAPLPSVPLGSDLCADRDAPVLHIPRTRAD